MDLRKTTVTVYNAGGRTLSELADNLQHQIDHCESSGGWADQVLYEEFHGDGELQSMSCALLICRHAQDGAPDD